MSANNVKILKYKRKTVGVILLLTVALVGKTFPQSSLQTITGPSYHHVHHSLASSDLDKGHSHEKTVDQTNLPHYHDEGLDTAEHKHCHAHLSQTIDTSFLGSDIYSPYQFAMMQNVEKFFKYDGLICSDISAKVFRPPIA